MNKKRNDRRLVTTLSNAGPTLASLCTGYGGLDMAAMVVFGGKLLWCTDNDKHVAKVIAARYPGVPNHGDLTQLDWRKVERADIICAGFPCQDISYSGKGLGIEKGERSGIWKNIIEGICFLRPSIIVVENVSAIRTRGLSRVLGDLAKNGYDSIWTSLRAGDIGAPHRRERVFVLAYDHQATSVLTAGYAGGERWDGRTARDQAESWWASGRPVGLGDLAMASTIEHPQLKYREASSVGQIAWGRYEAAIRRWEMLTGRRAPYPVERGARGQPRLATAFSEWLMGLPKSFVTGLGIPYNAQHRALGNGVVPQQAVVALSRLLDLAVRTDQSNLR